MMLAVINSRTFIYHAFMQRAIAGRRFSPPIKSTPPEWPP
jgi:hypothetical protein